MENLVKLTLRIPSGLHRHLRQRARKANRSLNSVIIETLREGIGQEAQLAETPEESALHILRESGLWEPLGPAWDQYIQDAPNLTHAELREKLKGVPPLSELIIEDREPR